MKKYIAPEMEIANFKMVDVLTVSGDTPITPATISGNTSTDLSADGAIQFSSNGAF